MKEQRFAKEFFKDLDSKLGYQVDSDALDRKRGRNTALNSYLNRSLGKLNSQSPGRSIKGFDRNRQADRSRTDKIKTLLSQLENHSGKKVPLNQKLENEYIQLSDLVNEFMKHSKRQSIEPDDGRIIELTQEEL